jgi:hypothetical protein
VVGALINSQMFQKNSCNKKILTLDNIMSTGVFIYLCQIILFMILALGSMVFCGIMLQTIEDLVSQDQPEEEIEGSLPWVELTFRA